MTGSNKTIDFSKVEEFFKNYSGQVYQKNDLDKGRAGRTAYEQCKNFLEKIKFDELIISDYPKWQIRDNEGDGIKAYCASFLWAQFKEKSHKNEPYSISVFWRLKENNQLKLSVQTELKNTDVAKATDEKKQVYISNFSKSSKIIPNGFKKNEYDIDNTEYSKWVLEKEIDLNQNSDNIVYNTKAAIQNLIPNYKAIFDKQKGEPTVQDINNKSNIPLNQILYGPPGTGKTYNTIVKAMEIIDGKKYTDNNGNLLETVKYEDLKQSFDEAKSNHQIEFITFHQSYSYEEFVEGIKPCIPAVVWEMDRPKTYKETDNLPDIKYIGQKGIFKDICNRADKHALVEPSFDKIKEYFNNNYKEYDYQTPEGKHFEIKELKDQAITIIPKDGETHFDIQYAHIEQLMNVDKEEISQDDLKAYCEDKDTTLNSYTAWYGSYYPAIVNTFKKIKEKLKQKKYVLIIDEINRGNISKIFGELITLIEEDKREKVYEDGKEYNTVKVTLPYSQDTFSVPNNLYIIGTMNTADRSIASVDIALRRRFRFIEMMPQPELLKTKDKQTITVVVKDKKEQYEIDLEKLLTVINNRISYILDDDHQIGHSYFLKLLQSKDGQSVQTISEEALKDVFKYEILPLLNEYFYGDWEKIKAVLVKDSENNENLVEGSFIEEKGAQTLSCYCGDKKQCRFKKEFNIKEAIECIADDIIQ